MPNADFSEQNDPWDSFAREISGEPEAPADPAESGSTEAPDETSAEPAPDAAEEPADDSVDAATTDPGNEEAAPVEAPEEEATPVEPAEGDVSWNFLAEELGIKDAGTEPTERTNPADELFSDYTPTVLEEDEPSVQADVANEESEFGEGVESESTDEAERPRRRRRGRRRSGRGRSTSEKSDDSDGNGGDLEATVAEEESAEENQSEASEEKPARRRRSRRRGKRGGKERNDSPDVDDDDDLGEEASGDESKEPSKHRKIPTWGEAISVVVDANIEAHAKKPANKPSKGRRSKAKPRSKR